jgi:hypothetical protein
MKRQFNGMLETLPFEIERRHQNALLKVSMALKSTYF